MCRLRSVSFGAEWNIFSMQKKIYILRSLLWLLQNFIIQLIICGAQQRNQPMGLGDEIWSYFLVVSVCVCLLLYFAVILRSYRLTDMRTQHFVFILLIKCVNPVKIEMESHGGDRRKKSVSFNPAAICDEFLKCAFSFSRLRCTRSDNLANVRSKVSTWFSQLQHFSNGCRA